MEWILLRRVFKCLRFAFQVWERTLMDVEAILMARKVQKELSGGKLSCKSLKKASSQHWHDDLMSHLIKSTVVYYYTDD